LARVTIIEVKALSERLISVH